MGNFTGMIPLIVSVAHCVLNRFEETVCCFGSAMVVSKGGRMVVHTGEEE